MEYSWSVDMHDSDGDSYDKCVLAHLGPNVIIRFENLTEMKQLAEKILRSVDEIKETHPNA